MAKYRSKVVIIDAIEFKAGEQPVELAQDVIDGTVRYTEEGTVLINTLEGVMCGQPGDWIIRGLRGELYPCKPDVFNMKYEAVDG